ncbi:PAS domain-containing protein [Leptolyngbya sp. PCC 6406]|uniref:PAS domain-containing sensor histidine kinase n=1 Tax=Leptolyngbya sp. PCC 6406 TaxID=1173264 RepID=UPI0002ABA248|nr:PAS domain-containing protein [Leptolyngbya sp. PCC 6406]
MSTQPLQQELLNLRQRNAALEQRLAALERSEAQASSCLQLQDIAATIPGIIFQFSVRNEVWTLDYISDRIGDLMAAPAREFQDLESVIRCQHPEDLDRYLASVTAAVSTLTPWHYEGRLIRPSGEIRWWQGDSVPTRNALGEVVFCGLILDITQQKELDQALQQSHEQIATILASINDAFLTLDRDWRFTYLNVQTEPILQRPAADLLGKNVWEEFPEAVGSDFYIYYHQAVETQQVVTFETYYPPLDRWFDVRAYPFQGGVSAYFRDISDRKAAEQALQRANAELEQRVEERTLALQQSVDQLQQEIRDREFAEEQLQDQSQLLRSIWDGVDYGIFVLDVLDQGAGFRYTAYNTAMERITPISFETLINRTIEEALPPEFAAVFQARYRTCIRSGQTLTFEENYQNEAGEESWWLVSVTPLRNLVGEIDQLVVTTTDICDRKQAEAALQRSEAELRQKASDLETTLRELQQTQSQLVQSEKMSSLGQLVAGVAHEINNPVNFIYGNLTHANQYIRDLLNLLRLYQAHYQQPIPAIAAATATIDLDFLMTDLPKLLSSMRVGADRIQKIVASLRNFSRLDEADLKSVDIHEGIDSTLMILQSRFRATAERPAIDLVQDYANLPPIHCYPGQLNQVFMNILSNALDALTSRDKLRSPEEIRQTPSQIRIQTRLVQGQVCIVIADNGPGIDAITRNRLFDPFFTTKPVGEGTGLGLSISYQIVTDRHGGTLICHSAPGKGAKFTITLPLERQS